VVHSRQPGRHRDEMTHHRQQPADEGGDFAVLQKEALGAGEPLLADEEVAAVPQQQRPAEMAGGKVVQVGAGWLPAVPVTMTPSRFSSPWCAR
jgi:hypothetical protein